MSEVETAVRRSLAQWADGVRPSWTAPDDVLHRVEVRRHRRRNRIAGTMAALTVVAVVGGAVLSSDDPSTLHTASGGGVGGAADVVPLGDPALLALDVPGWTVEYAMLGNDASDAYPGRMIDIRFTNGTQTFEVVSYPLGTRDTQHQNGTVAVRGLEGRLIPEGEDGRVRIDWDEGGQTVEADGTPFGSPDELAALLGQLRSVDDAGFVASLPPGVGDGLLLGVRSYPLDVPGFVTWYPGQVVQCSVDGRDVGPATEAHPVDPVAGC